MRGIINIVIGVVFIGGGLSGIRALRGTQSGGALAVLGGGLVLFGLFRLMRPAEWVASTTMLRVLWSATAARPVVR